MRGMVNFILDRLLPPDGVQPEPQPSLPELLERARQEWITARAYFDNVSDPALVDHAIYLVQAAERRYSYLLHQMRGQREASPGGALPGAGDAAGPAGTGEPRDVGGLAGASAAPVAPEACALPYRPGEPSVPDPNRPPGRPAGPQTPGGPGRPARLDEPGAPGATRAVPSPGMGRA